jgi:hypothetical protein
VQGSTLAGTSGRGLTPAEALNGTIHHTAPFRSAFDARGSFDEAPRVAAIFTLVEEEGFVRVELQVHVPAASAFSSFNAASRDQGSRMESDADTVALRSTFDAAPVNVSGVLAAKRFSGTGTYVDSAASGFAPVVSLQGAADLCCNHGVTVDRHCR